MSRSDTSRFYLNLSIFYSLHTVYNYKQCLRTNGINIKKLPTEAPKVTSLELFFNGFVDLHCLKKFAKIEKLVLFGSDLSALFRVDFGCCLTELWLCETKLKRIPDLTACPLIERLFLYGNRLNKVENLSHLRNLQVSATVRVTQNPNLDVLN